MPKTKRKRYKITNWSKYNQALVDGGDITLWFSDEAIKQWEHENTETKVGRPYQYSDTSIECLLTIRELLKLPYRQTEGFAKSLVKLMGISIEIPNYSSLAKRAAKLNIALQIANKKGPINILVDSTGLKVFGEGEWKMRTHGKSKRRTWRKLHLAVDAKTQEIVAEALTENSCHDSDPVPEMLNEIPQPINTFYGDGGYDKWKVYDALADRNVSPVIPPQHNAKIKQHGNSDAEPLPRDEAIRHIRRTSSRQWKKEVGYHRRSLAETAVYRVKQTFGHHLKNRKLNTQQTEARIRCKIINQFSKLPMPDFVWH